MASSDRTGNRTKRDKRQRQLPPELGYYLIVTDTEATERCYFNGLRDSLPDSVRKKLVIKVVETKTKNLLQKCLELTAYDPQYRIPWIVFDRDMIPNFDQIIKDASAAGINVGWSNPCFEIWLFAYWGNMPNIERSWTCCDQFESLFKSRTGHDYLKSDAELYRRLIENGNEETAINVAKRKHTQCKRSGIKTPSQMIPCTTVYELVGEIKCKSHPHGTQEA